MAATPPQPPADWYPDPWQQASERWWDGTEWTDQTRTSEAVETSGRTGTLILGAVVLLVVVLLVVTSIVSDDNGETSSLDAQRCAEQWERADLEGRHGDGDDSELMRTFTVCPDYPTWQAEKDRVGGQSPNALRAGCLLDPESRVCRDASQRGLVD